MRPANATAVALRRARTTVAGLACLYLTVVMHAVGGGGVDMIAFAFCAPVAFALGSLLVKFRHRALVLAGGLLSAQALLHLILSVTCAPAVSAAANPSASAMVAAHVVAAAMAAATLRHADRIADAWLRFLASLRNPLPALVAVDVLSTRVLTPTSPLSCGRLAWAATAPRGPPAY